MSVLGRAKLVPGTEVRCFPFDNYPTYDTWQAPGSSVSGLLFVLWQDSEVSAFCCTRWTPLVNNSRVNSRGPSITARPTSAEKDQFAELAAARGISESALALIAIRALLDSNGGSPPNPATGEARRPATDRITIRLRPGDRHALLQRAARRGIRPSRYVAALVRAHIAASPPLTIEEISILKRSVAVLAMLSRALSHTAQSIAQAGTAPPSLQTELSQTRAVVAAIEQRTHDLARSALITWESQYE